ncbi:MAG: DUF2946 family protein [Alphaproteobacteria bacterium]|nr:DUF2946 family protein [Alphaproteobacteria bacterium]
MQQRLKRFLAVFVIAVAAQLLAPIAASWAAAAAASDPLAFTEICHSDQGDPANPGDTGKGMDCASCPFCAVVVQAGASFDTPVDFSLVAPCREGVNVTWLTPVHTMTLLDPGGVAQARAPPVSVA